MPTSDICRLAIRLERRLLVLGAFLGELKKELQQDGVSEVTLTAKEVEMLHAVAKGDSQKS